MIMSIMLSYDKISRIIHCTVGTMFQNEVIFRFKQNGQV